MHSMMAEFGMGLAEVNGETCQERAMGLATDGIVEYMHACFAIWIAEAQNSLSDLDTTQRQ